MHGEPFALIEINQVEEQSAFQLISGWCHTPRWNCQMAVVAVFHNKSVNSALSVDQKRVTEIDSPIYTTMRRKH